jgi:hypothetical protein
MAGGGWLAAEGLATSSLAGRASLRSLQDSLTPFARRTAAVRRPREPKASGPSAGAVAPRLPRASEVSESYSTLSLSR